MPHDDDDAAASPTYDVENACATPLAGPFGFAAAIGPPGPAGPAGTGKFPFIFVFGNVNGAPVAGDKIAIPVPTDGTFRSMQIRVANDVVANATFALRYASTPTGALASVGGTAPSITGVKGSRVTSVDWTTQDIVEGGVLECEYVSGTAGGVTLMVEFEQPT